MKLPRFYSKHTAVAFGAPGFASIMRGSAARRAMS
jgi:hypothetical protein